MASDGLGVAGQPLTSATVVSLLDNILYYITKGGWSGGCTKDICDVDDLTRPLHDGTVFSVITQPNGSSFASESFTYSDKSVLTKSGNRWTVDMILREEFRVPYKNRRSRWPWDTEGNVGGVYASSADRLLMGRTSANETLAQSSTSIAASINFPAMPDFYTLHHGAKGVSVRALRKERGAAMYDMGQISYN